MASQSECSVAISGFIMVKTGCGILNVNLNQHCLPPANNEN